jgi:hypothetical protein
VSRHAAAVRAEEAVRDDDAATWFGIDGNVAPAPGTEDTLPGGNGDLVLFIEAGGRPHAISSTPATTAAAKLPVRRVLMDG